jgi:hypothetical protein
LRMDERPPIWRVAANILNKPSRIADKGYLVGLYVSKRGFTVIITSFSKKICFYGPQAVLKYVFLVLLEVNSLHLSRWC